MYIYIYIYIQNVHWNFWNLTPEFSDKKLWSQSIYLTLFVKTYPLLGYYMSDIANFWHEEWTFLRRKFQSCLSQSLEKQIYSVKMLCIPKPVSSDLWHCFPPPVLLNTVYKSCVIRPLCWCWKFEKRKPNCSKYVRAQNHQNRLSHIKP